MIHTSKVHAVCIPHLTITWRNVTVKWYCHLTIKWWATIKWVLPFNN